MNPARGFGGEASVEGGVGASLVSPVDSCSYYTAGGSVAFCEPGCFLLAELKQWAVGADVECGFDVLDCLVEVFEFGVELVGIGGVTYGLSKEKCVRMPP